MGKPYRLRHRRRGQSVAPSDLDEWPLTDIGGRLVHVTIYFWTESGRVKIQSPVRDPHWTNLDTLRGALKQARRGGEERAPLVKSWGCSIAVTDLKTIVDRFGRKRSYRFTK